MKKTYFLSFSAKAIFQKYLQRKVETIYFGHAKVDWQAEILTFTWLLKCLSDKLQFQHLFPNSRDDDEGSERKSVARLSDFYFDAHSTRLSARRYFFKSRLGRFVKEKVKSPYVTKCTAYSLSKWRRADLIP